MITVTWHALRETIHRRMGLAVIVLALLVPGFLMWKANFRHAPDGRVMVTMGGVELAAQAFVQGTLGALLGMSQQLWTWVGIFAAAPLLTSYLEKGWAEMQFAKGLPRWQFLMGRYLASVLVFGLSLFCLAGLPALYLGLRTGISTRSYFGALALGVFNFAVLAAVMALVSIQQAPTALPTLTAFLTMLLSAALAGRKETFFTMISSEWVKSAFDWAYRILPKSSEVGRAAVVFWQKGAVEDWWPLWSTALFLAGALGLAIWSLQRKSF